MNMNGLIRRRPVPTAPEPLPQMSQDEQREHRRQWLRVTYGGAFDLTAEVAAIVTPLADNLARLPGPLALREQVNEVADAVHELLSTVVGMLAESRHLDAAASARTRSRVADLAQRPAEPRLTDKAITAGTWAAVLVEHVEPHSADFAAFLGSARPPNDPHLTAPSASDRLVEALRILDVAAHDLGKIIPKAAVRQALPSIEQFNAAQRERLDRERADRALAKIGARP